MYRLKNPELYHLITAVSSGCGGEATRAAGLSGVADTEEVGHTERNQSRQTHIICPWGFWGGNSDSDFKKVENYIFALT